MLSQLVLADLQKQIAQEVRNAYIKSLTLKKALVKEWLLSFHPLTPSHLHWKNHTRPKQKQPERELKCHNKNLRASEVASLPFPVFRLTSIPSELISHKKGWEMTSDIAQEHKFFHRTASSERTHQRGSFQRKPWNSLQPAYATILNGAPAARHLDKLGVAQFPFLEASWAVNSYTDICP